VGYRPGAGFIVFRKFKDGIKFLGLKGPEDIRKSRNGIWDLPKGTKEPGETDFQCAQREAFEEAGIFIINSDVVSGPYEISACSIYLVESSETPKITRNPVSGIYEHEGYAWLSPKKMEDECYTWLKPFIQWARQELSI